MIDWPSIPSPTPAVEVISWTADPASLRVTARPAPARLVALDTKPRSSAPRLGARGADTMPARLADVPLRDAGPAAPRMRHGINDVMTQDMGA